MTAASAVIAGTTHLIFDGQSFAYTPTEATSHYGVLLSLLPAHRYTSRFVATAASTYTERAATAASRVDATIPKDRPSVLIDVGGFSDIWQSGGNLTAAAALAAAESYWDARRAAGVDYIIAATVTKTTGAWLDADGETQRVALNALILASTHVDAVADIASLPHAADPSDTTYFTDGLHPAALLAAEIAVTFEGKMATLGLPT